jgi:hypothetical protein
MARYTEDKEAISFVLFIGCLLLLLGIAAAWVALIVWAVLALLP